MTPAALDLARRETSALELMDDPDCDPVALDRTYAHFALVNRLVSGWRGLYTRRIRPLAARSPSPLTVVDIGCGGGDLARALARWSRRDGVPLDVTAVDPDERALEFATSRPETPGVTFERAASRDLVAAGRRFDLVVSNHVLHHLDDPSLEELLRDSDALGGRLVLHNDIARSRLAYGAYAVATTGTFRGSFIHADGLLSIRRSYTPSELAAAVGPSWRVESPHPARLVVTRA